MRTSIFAVFLALVKSQKSAQVCKLDKYENYFDADCTKPKDESAETQQYIVGRVNEMMSDGPRCMYFSPENQGPKFKITCLSSEALKFEQFNHMNEDENCQYPYPRYADKPSYTAKNGECVETERGSYTKFYISSTTGEFEKTDNSWEITDYGTPKTEEDTYTTEWRWDNSRKANSCVVQNFQLYYDAECTKPDEGLNDEMREYYIGLSNDNIRSKECQFMDQNSKRGVKRRSYCVDSETITINVYNIMNEDPYCLRPYPEQARYASYTAGDGKCVQVEANKYAKFKISPNEDWEDENDTEEYDEDESDDSIGQNGMSISGDNYEVSVQTEKDENGNDEITTEAKFDNYFMYGIDNMGGNSKNMPPCGPGADHNTCKDTVNSDETCCTHIVMLDEGREQQAFYRCMNQKVVDASFSFEIDGIRMSMACNGQSSGAANFTTYVFASILALMVTTLI